MKAVYLFAAFIIPISLHGQNSRSLKIEECYVLARENYPLVRQHLLIEKSNNYTIENIAKGALPQISVSGQASYQSDVTTLPIQLPGMNVPAMSKDQYRLTGEVSQPLTDLITVKQQKELQEMNRQVQTQNLEVELYKIKDRINQLFFGILLIDEQLVQNNLTKKDIQSGINKVSAALRNGTDFRSSLDKLKAEMLKAQQRDIDLKSSRSAYTAMLGLFINQTLNDSTKFDRPEEITSIANVNRPEVTAYDFQKKTYDLQNQLLNTRSLPKFSLFFQGGLGKPSPVNMLSNELSGYYLGGLRLNWSLSSFYTLKKEKKINDIAKEAVEVQRETFLFNTKQLLRQQNEEINKIRKLINTDRQIVDLRSSVKTASNAQLENGVITVNDYLREVYAEEQARQSVSLHQIQLLMAQYNYRTTSGN
ncbi:outer membrane protein TolC [Arcticibacter tournemirensis]|uniref:TolC family protein n=1 Tax=Arcticibacter tournemirensis TaxID=699437 RepID=A0A4Q0M7Q1_9SPHI|nr:TolC family protein [Arcticibacter tournemirensis]KAA8484119.1 TolC family protein [Arcticibacter tournemirensis]RXF68913.1 TolC family protein [Arcticibacter tournemirensis]TQM51860.1 outer membrane protein TolC [Arcticibacter tournemirensis]